MKHLISLTFLYFIVLCSNGQTASFNYATSNGVFCSPATVNFTQTCTGNPIGYSWTFSNGQTSTAPNPSIVFITGSYTVRLTAIFPNEAITTQQIVNINPAVTASLTADRNYICQPGTINFTASSTGGASSYEWAFGDGNTAITSTPTVSYNYTTYNNFNATVKVIAPSGCFANANYGIAVQRPVITANATPTSGCIPTTVNFTASVNVPIGDNVATYTWDFGDGSPTSTTTIGSISHPYTIVGTYTPSVSITTNVGCSNSINLPPIAFGTPPTGTTASSDKLVYCGSETPVFTASATNANAYTWNFGDGTIITTASNTITHRYLTLGTKNVTVTPLFNGCAGALFNLPAIDIVGVITSFNYANTCGAKNTFIFNNTTQGNQSTIIWSFGDGSPNSNIPSPTHTYPTNGTWVTTLTVTDNVTGCSDVSTATIYTATPTLTNPDVSICNYTNTTFTVNSDYANHAAKTYEWHIFGQALGPNTTNPFTVQATPLGIYNNSFVIIRNGTQYCPDTVYLSNIIEVKGPDISFTMPASICLSDTLRMTNTSLPTPSSATFTTTFWNYGSIATNDTTFQPNPVNYSVAGNYQIKFVAVDINGCRDSLIKPLVVNPLPFLRIIPRSDTLCEGSSLPLIAFHTDNIVWSPSTNLSCTTCDTTIANPTVSRQYYATATNSFGCTLTDSTFITVINDFTATPVQSPVFICLNDSTRINVLPANKVISWLPNTNISSTNSYNPFVYPKVNTTYTATVSDSVGCFTKTVPIQVIVNPLPTVNAGDDKFVSYNTPFTITPIYSNNIETYRWTPAGNLNCTACPTPTGTALDQHQYTILVTSNDGCIARDTITIFVDCKDANIYMPTAFTPNGDNLNDFYYPLTRGIKNIKKFIIYNRAGKLVFSRSNFTPNTKTLGWNGSVNGTKQNMDSYIYILEATCFTGRDVEIKGMFTLIR